MAYAALVFFIMAVASAQAQPLKSKAPDFTLPDLNGKNVTLSSLLGEGPLFLNFWATWCPPCKKEIPEIINVYNKYHKRGLKVVSVSTDNKGLSAVKPFVEARKIPYLVLLDPEGEVSARKYKVSGIPYSLLLDAKGTIVKKYLGYTPGFEADLSAEVEKLLPPEKKEPAAPKEEKSEE